MKKKNIYSIIRDEHGQRIGLVVAIGPGIVGFSKVHPRTAKYPKGEKFDLKEGISHAIARAIDPDTFGFKNSEVEGSVPPEFQFPLEKIRKSSHKYFAPAL